MREKGSCALAQRANSMNSDKGGAPHTPKPQVDTALLVTCFLTRRNSLVKLGLHEFVEEPGLQPQGHCLGSALARGACRLRATCEIHANDRDRFSALSPPPPPPCRRALVKRRHRHQARKPGATRTTLLKRAPLKKQTMVLHLQIQAQAAAHKTLRQKKKLKLWQNLRSLRSR